MHDNGALAAHHDDNGRHSPWLKADTCVGGYKSSTAIILSLLQEVSTANQDDEADHPLHPPVQSGLLHPCPKQGGAGQGPPAGHHLRADPEPDQWSAGHHHHQRDPCP